MNLERLIRLAQRTGDRLIIHDEFGGDDVAVLPIAEYEKLVDKIEMCKLLHEREHDGVDFPFDSEPWRDEMSEIPDVVDVPFGPPSSVGTDFGEPRPEDDFDFDFDIDDELEDEGEWDAVGDVIEDRYGTDTIFDEEDEEVVGWTPPHFDYYGREIPREDFSFEDIPIEDIPFGPPSSASTADFGPLRRSFSEASEASPPRFGEARPLPRRFSTIDDETSPYRVRDWEEEPLPSEEPVFYEEPV